MEAKSFTPIFLEGKGLPRDWSILVEKLCYLGVVSSLEKRTPPYLAA